jgi:hypothetical protein
MQPITYTTPVKRDFCNKTSGSWMASERGASLVRPLAGQLTNSAAWGREAYAARVRDGLAPLVGALAGSLQHAAVLRDLNYHMLLGTRHEAPEVRLAALELVSVIVGATREAYADQLADSAPTLHELLSDADERVETRTNALLSQIEQETGQSMDKYF